MLCEIVSESYRVFVCRQCERKRERYSVGVSRL